MNMPYLLTRQHRKSLAIYIHADNSVEIRAPLGLTLPKIDQFYQKMIPWIKKKQKEQFEQSQPLLKPHQILYQGIILDILYNPEKSCHGELLENTLFFGGKDPQQIDFLAKKWLYAKSANTVISTAKEISEKFYLQDRIHKFILSSARSRWGSCSSSGTLSLNWRLIMLPTPVFHHVIIHELAHLTQMNHSAAFWETVKMMDKDYLAHNQWLKENSKRIFAL